MTKIKKHQLRGHRKNVGPVSKGVESLLDHHIQFCFRYVQQRYKPSDGKVPKGFKHFLQKIERLSEQTLGQIYQQPKDIGTEKIPVGSLLTVKVPAAFPVPVGQVDVFRFGGKAHRVIGVISGHTFHVFWVDYLLKLYKH